MGLTITTQLLDRLERAAHSFGLPDHDKVSNLLTRFSKLHIKAAESLIRYHELLLFVRAYPRDAQMLKRAEKELASFPRRVERLQADEVDLSVAETPDISGIVGTSATDTFSYPIVRWLAKLDPSRVALDWEWFEDEYRLAATWPRFMPLLDEDASVEANVPYSEWLQAAVGREREVPWLVKRFESLNKPDREKAELYESQKLYVRWTPSYRASRTGMRLAGSKRFYHREPLIKRRDVSLPAELESQSPPLQLLSPEEGEAILDMAREASTVRYRELWGFTHGDPRRVFATYLGRGVQIFITGLPPGRRLPLRAYHAAMIFKNGIAIGYFEGLSLFERMESGFNLYYTFRDGETAWLYAKTLNVFRHLAGVTAFAIDPYQIGFENEEGIESGAFWFYRKLGFRPTTSEIMKSVEREEERLARRPGYRTPARTLRKIAEGPMIFEMDKENVGDWDGFQVRKIGLLATRLMAKEYDGDVQRMEKEIVSRVGKLLGADLESWSAAEMAALADFAAVLTLIPDFSKWTTDEKQQLVKIIKAKNRGDETVYLKLMQKHQRLRRAMISVGS